jgi:hypothetical protein
MNDYLPVALAFVLGYLVHIGASRYGWRARRFLYGLRPRRCPNCGTWHLDKHMHHARHKIAGHVLICKECYEAEFTPFTVNGKAQ